MSRIKLDDIANKTAFKVPERYFEELPLRIQSRLIDDTERPYYIRYKVQLSSLAFTLLIAFSIWTFFNGSSSEGLFLADVTDEQIMLYLESQEWDEKELFAALDHEFAYENFSEEIETLDFGDNDLELIYDEFNLDPGLNF